MGPLATVKTRFRRRPQIQDFDEIRNECLERGILWEDPKFPAEDSSLFFSKKPDKPFQWRRPTEIVRSPKLIVNGGSRFDVQQGELGDCWLLAAIANVTLNNKLFHKIVPDDQSFDENYVGAFHFRFWRYGHWIDVVVDDRLPTIAGMLVFLHSSTHNEFWSALLEKAYAKVFGSYEALKGGTTCEAMEDFSGGVMEIYELKDPPPNLYKIMLKGYRQLSLMACSIEPDPVIKEKETAEGLIKGHAYSVTKVQYVHSEAPNAKGKIPLIRLRNPWGNQIEWNGAWSDKSPEWEFIPESEKKAIGLTFDADGEFWMSYEDFTTYFNRLEICNLNPDSLTEETDKRKKWETSLFEGKWVKGVSAGGCRKYLETFCHNPQYRITLEDPDEDEDEEDEQKNKCTVIIALMQKNRRSQKKMRLEFLTIGYEVYHLENPDKLPKPLDIEFFKYTAPVAQPPAFVNSREVSCRFKLPPGVYCIVPSTFQPNEEGEFLIRVFSEHKNNMIEHDQKTGIGEVDKRVVRRERQEGKKDSEVNKLFKKIAGDDMKIDWVQLKEILDHAMRPELPGSTTAQKSSNSKPLLSLLCGVVEEDNANTQISEMTNAGFSKDACRSMIATMDVDRSGKIGYEQFKDLWRDVTQWKAVFKLYDKDGKGYLNAFELRQAVNSAGYNLDKNTLHNLNHRYGTRAGIITFDDYMMCTIRLRSMINTFQQRDPDNTRKSTFTLEEWIDKSLYT